MHVVVGCPGRVLSMIKEKHLSLSALKYLVIDEADEMLSKGFLDNMKDTISFIPPEAKILLFSATMPEEIVQLTKNFMTNPAKILVDKEHITLEGIKQYYVLMQKEDKFDVLLDVYRNVEIVQAVIFCNSKHAVDALAEKLVAKGHMVGTMYGEKTMDERMKTMNAFRGGAIRVLITTDLLARGIDVNSVSLVINYDLPKSKETYIHRIGRSGRLGKKGTAINFVIPYEVDELEDLKKFYKTNIDKLPTDLSEI